MDRTCKLADDYSMVRSQMRAGDDSLLTRRASAHPCVRKRRTPVSESDVLLLFSSCTHWRKGERERGKKGSEIVTFTCSLVKTVANSGATNRAK